MKVVYIAGPFRGLTQWDMAENIRAAERIGLLVAKSGAMPLIPHANTAHFHGQQTDQFWLDGTLELLRRCDAAVFLPRWRKSRGSVGEYQEAVVRGLPCLSLDEYQEWAFACTVHAFITRVVDNAQVNHPEEQRAACSPAEDGTGQATGFDSCGYPARG